MARRENKGPANGPEVTADTLAKLIGAAHERGFAHYPLEVAEPGDHGTPQERFERLVNESREDIRVVKFDYPEDERYEMNPKNFCEKCSVRLCCRYVRVPITEPTTKREADILLWAVAHHNVSLCIADSQWWIMFQTTCDSLLPNGDCGIYETRPEVCRDHSNTGCEFHNNFVGQESAAFDLHLATHAETIAYFRRRFRQFDVMDIDDSFYAESYDEDAEEDTVTPAVQALSTHAGVMERTLAAMTEALRAGNAAQALEIRDRMMRDSDEAGTTVADLTEATQCFAPDSDEDEEDEE